MKRALAAVAAAALGLAASAAAGPAAESPVPAPSAALADRLEWNARERTAAGSERFATGDGEGAAEALDTALRLRPEDPLAAYNAGAGRLAAGRADAVEPLERATRAADPAWAADAFYNLGSARLANGDARGAVDALIESLRRAPERTDAKHNLELARRALAEQQGRSRQQPDPQHSPTGDRGAEERSAGDARERPHSPAGDGAPPSDAGDEAGEKPGGSSGQGERASEAPETGPDARGDSSRDSAGARSTSGPGSPPVSGARLPGFQDQPELDAEQAAALLQAIENLERQQRRERARELARARGREEIDW